MKVEKKIYVIKLILKNKSSKRRDPLVYQEINNEHMTYKGKQKTKGFKNTCPKLFCHVTLYLIWNVDSWPQWHEIFSYDKEILGTILSTRRCVHQEVFWHWCVFGSVQLNPEYWGRDDTGDLGEFHRNICQTLSMCQTLCQPLYTYILILRVTL